MKRFVAQEPSGDTPTKPAQEPSGDTPARVSPPRGDHAHIFGSKGVVRARQDGSSIIVGGDQNAKGKRVKSEEGDATRKKAKQDSQAVKLKILKAYLGSIGATWGRFQSRHIDDAPCRKTWSCKGKKTPAESTK